MKWTRREEKLPDSFIRDEAGIPISRL
jgi:hypothetical protein